MLGKTIPLLLWDIESVWVGAGVMVKTGFSVRICGCLVVVYLRYRRVLCAG